MEGTRGHPNPLNSSKPAPDAVQPKKQLSKKLGSDALRQAALVLLESNSDLKEMFDTSNAEKDEALRERNAAFRMHEDISAKYKESMRTCENIRLALTRAADETAREKKESSEQIAFLLDTIKQLTSSKDLLLKEKVALEKFFHEKLSAAESERTICLKSLEAVRDESLSKIAAKTEETARSKEELAAALQKVESTQQMYEKLYDTEVLYVRNVLIPETNRQREIAEMAAKEATAAAALSHIELQSSQMREQCTQEAFQGLQKTLLAAKENLEEQKQMTKQALEKCAAEEQKTRDALSHAIMAEESFQMASKLLQSKTELEIEAVLKGCESNIEKMKRESEIIVSSAKVQNETELRLVRQLSEVEVAKYKAIADNASKKSLDYASLHGYESWMQALQSAQEDARRSRENELEAIKQTGYVVEELKKMTMYKERAELETKQVISRYGGFSLKQLIYPSEMSTAESDNLLVEPSNELKQHDKTDDSTSFFSTFRRKLKEKFSNISKKEDDRASHKNEIEPETRLQMMDRQAESAIIRKSPVSDNQARLPLPIARKASVLTPKVDGSPLAFGKLKQSQKRSPQLLPSRGNIFDESPLSKSPANHMKHSPTSSSGYEGQKMISDSDAFQLQPVSRSREHDVTAKIESNRSSRAEYKSVAPRNSGTDQSSIKDDTSDHSSRTTNRAESHSSKGSSRPSSADSGSLQSAREVHEGRLPPQYQFFRTRQSNLTVIPKLSLATPRYSEASGARYHMRRDLSIKDPTQCAWLQKASGPLAERIRDDFDVRVELLKVTERHKFSAVQVALKGQTSSVQSAAEFIFGIIDNLRLVSVTFHQFDSTNPGITVSENEDAILKDLRIQLKRLDQLPTFWPIDVDAKILDLEVPSPKSPKNVQFRSLQSPIMITASVSEIDRHFIDAISGHIRHISEQMGLRV